MAKELIVSVNGREKKIAIVEDERVTEFYIERGEENQGIVGNIYKGRVMRVLPGMQSAFVDIGLERDAFLYVSDFFDEEEEFERIVIDKSKKGDQASAERAAQEHIEKARIEREHRIEATHERAEPLLDSEPAEIEEEDDVVVVAAPIELVQEQQPAPEQETESGKRRGKRGRRRDKGAKQPVESRPAVSHTQVTDIETPFVVGGASFERVVDDEVVAAENGEMFKDARLQERIFDQIHAVEFDMEDVPTAEVGSLLQGSAPATSSFQRVDDSDVASDAASRPTAQVQEAVAAHVDTFIDEVTGETLAAPAQTFERVSDDEEMEAPRGKRAAKRAASKKSKRAAGEAEKPKRAAKKGAKKAPEKKSPAKKSSTAKGRKRSAASEAKSVANSEAMSEEATSNTEEVYEDAEASVASSRPRAEFATRRGGRRRRRGGSAKPQQASAAETDRSNGKDEESAELSDADESNDAPPPVHAAHDNGRRERSNRRDSVDRKERSDRSERTDRSDRGDRGERNERSERSDRGSRPGSRHQPTITDLLREGQEVLVQIAKEPIAKKGARITSHIALPGRYLVYMPTVEHVGVSRKIESDQERARLRKLIQTIRATETVPSGGFIVRTAGTGVTEEDLRDDARYLVRTWLDIRRGAERAKAPALVHQDLDLVERILRDQLSDDFAAIRVDSEEEYQRIVEFINRIQPRMVKRVKLYTRDTPILEAFGVQVEIEKAIKPRVWLKSGGYLVINQTEALVAIDVNTGKFVGRGGSRLEDTITKTNMEAVDEIIRQIRLRDLGGIIVLDLIDMEERRNRQRVMQALHEALQHDKSPTKVLSFNDFGLVIMTRKRVKQSLERTLCAPCSYCQGAGLIKSPQTICYEILEEARRLARNIDGDTKQTTLRINPEVARVLRSTERDVLNEIEDYLGAVDITSDPSIHQEQFDFAFI
ncbi:MAG: hypothetical protein AUG51_02070 [Acidobacteria bacterium 13_1_20CM_3_53_8]|nr:MAG: hypothetical protein AUG51_02070 [Acidobacteria bacterium 13_1_20CM_3_53_8]